MFHAEDHLRLTGQTGFSVIRRARQNGLRPCARNTDVDALLEKTGLAGLARRI